MMRQSSVTPEKVNIKPNVSVLSVLRHLNYKPWFALAEFVDNSFQSYSAKRASLEELHGKDFKVVVRIDIDSQDSGRISIKDNAAGIALGDYSRAFIPAALPKDATGLSEFGMGMKSASCWFSPNWYVRTKALGEEEERTVSFDVEKIVSEQVEELDITTRKSDKNSHFTEIVLEELHRVPKSKTISKIKEHLSDIYRVFIRNGRLQLIFNDDELSYTEPPILMAPDTREVEGEKKEWRKKINFDFGEGLSAKGFAALRAKGEYSRSGFALFRRGRLIQGSGDEGYRPEHIFGKPNSFRSLRLFGELHLEGFEVSHTKDGFRWDENEQPFLEFLKEHLDQEDLPLLYQAENYRVREVKEETNKAARQALESTVATLESKLPDTLPIVVEQPLVETQSTELSSKTIIEQRELTVEFRGKKWRISIELSDDPAESQWLTLSNVVREDDSTNFIQIRVSLVHPFMEKFTQSDPDELEALLRIAAGLALAEVLARQKGQKKTGTIRRNLNNLLREVLSETSFSV